MLKSLHPNMEGAAPRRRSCPFSVARLVTKSDVFHGTMEVPGRVVGSRVMEDFVIRQHFLSTKMYRRRCG